MTNNKQPCDDEFVEDSYFSKVSQKSFFDREKILRAHKKWPLTQWYNDEDFCEVYKQAADIIGRQWAEIEELKGKDADK